MTDFLAIDLGPQGHALPLSDIAGLYSGKPVTRIPTHVPSLLGIAGFRGTIAPVYDLHLLLGHAPLDRARWLVMAAGAPVAFAFAAFGGHLRVPHAQIVAGKADHGGPVRDAIKAHGRIRPIVHLPSIFERIDDSAPERQSGEDQGHV
jgi:purine-binding chemotaxis protein CheW